GKLDAPAQSGTLAIPIAIGVTPGGPPVSGYFVSTSSTLPKTTATVWVSVPPATVDILPGDTTRTIYAWLKSDEGDVSPTLTATVLLDTIKPTAQLSIQGASKSRSVKVTAAGTDEGTGIGAWLLTQSPVIPTANDGRWTSTKPSSFTLSSGDGTKRVYLWTRDKVRNVSVPAWADVRLDTKDPSGAVVPRWQ